MSNLQKFIVLVILILGFALRLHNFDIYPQRGATSDEYTYAFLGLSLLTKGVPISWSHFGDYKHRTDMVIDKIFFPIVWPYFDHPPLNGIVVAVWALIHGQYTFEQVQLPTIRLVPIIFSVLSTIFIFLITFKIADYHTAFWAILIYSTVTIFVIQSRVVLAENLLTPIFLGAIYSYQRLKHHKMNNGIILLGFLSVSAFWTKEIGFILAASIFILLVSDRVAKKYVLIYISIVLLGFLGYVMYGFLYDWDTFVKIIKLQSTRDIGTGTLWYLLSTPLIINKIYYDGWYYFGFFALASLLQNSKKYRVIVIPSVFYFLFLLFSLTQHGELGWYMIPLYPFFSIASAVVLRRSVEKHDGLFGVFVTLVGFVFIQSVFNASFGLTGIQFRILFIILMTPWIVSLLYYKHRFSSLFSTAYFYIFIALSIYTTYTYVHPV